MEEVDADGGGDGEGDDKDGRGRGAQASEQTNWPALRTKEDVSGPRDT